MGFMFRGKHPGRDIGVYTTVRDRPYLAPPKTNFNEDVPYMDGSLDFSQTGGRVFYQDKILEVDFDLKQSDARERNRAIERFAAWLAGGEGELILDDMPLVKWLAYPINTGDIRVQLSRLGKCTVEFRCKPFNTFLYSTGEGVPLDSDIELDSDIPIGWGAEFDIVNGKNKITVTNDGSAPVRPVIEVSGSFRSITITCGGKSLSYNFSFTEIEIDCAAFGVFEGETDVTDNSEGEFFELNTGDNEITVTASGSGTVIFDFNPGYFYDTLF